MGKGKENVFPMERKFQVDGETIVIRPLNWAEAMDVDELIIRILEKMGDQVNYLTLAKTAAWEILELIAQKSGKSVEFLQSLPAYLVAEMMVAFLEVNKFENFFQSIARGAALGKEIFSGLFNGSSPTVTAMRKSKGTPSGK